MRFVFILEEPEGPTFLVPAGETLLLKGSDWPKDTLLHPQEENRKEGGGVQLFGCGGLESQGTCVPKLRAQDAGARDLLPPPTWSCPTAVGHDVCCADISLRKPSGSSLPGSSPPSNNPQH